jgi:hypothetical protein
MSSWSTNFKHALAERGVDPAQARQLDTEALEQAADHRLEPEQMFGPATAYADQIARALRVPSASPLPAPHPPSAALRLTGVSKRYGRRHVLCGLSMEVNAGESVAVVGANGCGKSTLSQICAGTTRPPTGTVELVAHVGYVTRLATAGGPTCRAAQWCSSRIHLHCGACAASPIGRSGRATPPICSMGSPTAPAPSWFCSPSSGASVFRLRIHPPHRILRVRPHSLAATGAATHAQD